MGIVDLGLHHTTCATVPRFDRKPHKTALIGKNISKLTR